MSVELMSQTRKPIMPRGYISGASAYLKKLHPGCLSSMQCLSTLKLVRHI